MTPKSILAFDIDGTLTSRNQLTISPGSLVPLLRYLQDLGHYPVLITGKPLAYASKVLEANRLPLKGILAENAGVYQGENGESTIFGSGVEEITALKRILGLAVDAGNVTQIKLSGKKYEVVVDPDDISILTIFTNPAFISHRWQFTHSIEVAFLYEKMQQILEEHNLHHSLQVVPPFPDEAIQVIRKEKTTGIVIDKSMLSQSIALLFDAQPSLPKAMFGDGHNDIPAMLSQGVIPLTFANGEDAVKQTAQAEGGFISKYSAVDDIGIPDGILWLAETGTFFGEDSEKIKNYLLSQFPALHNTTQRK